MRTPRPRFGKLFRFVPGDEDLELVKVKSACEAWSLRSLGDARGSFGDGSVGLDSEVEEMICVSKKEMMEKLSHRVPGCI